MKDLTKREMKERIETLELKVKILEKQIKLMELSTFISCPVSTYVHYPSYPYYPIMLKEDYFFTDHNKIRPNTFISTTY